MNVSLRPTMTSTQPRFVRSSYILVAVAMAWVGGFVLLKLAYVQPNISRRAEQVERDAAGEWLRLTNQSIRARRSQMLRHTIDWARDRGLLAYLGHRRIDALNGEIPPESLAKNRIACVLICDRNATLLTTWTPGGAPHPGENDGLKPGDDLSGWEVFGLASYADEFSGVANTPLGLGLFARAAIRASPTSEIEGYLVSIRPVDNLLLGELSAMVGVTVSLQGAPELPPGRTAPQFGQIVWRGADRVLKGTQLYRDSTGKCVGYLVVKGRAEPAYRQTRTVERAISTTMLWAIGFALLMILLIHVVVSGPTAKLVERVHGLHRGQPVNSLSAGLRGEALALARQFEEVLGHVEKLSETDSLTGLSNRRSFQQSFVHELRRARRYGRPLTLALMDVDYLKAANDALGHQTGDEMLRVFAQVALDSVRASDLVARLGGDEFAILMPETTADEAESVAERIRRHLATKTIGRGEMKMSLSASIGVVDANCPGGQTPEGMFGLADRALYAAKRAGRNRVIRAEQIEDAQDGGPAYQDQTKVDDLCKQLAGLDAKFKRLFVEAIGGLISALEARDKHTANHSAKVRHYALLIARQMDLPQHTTEHIARAAMLHDIGKIGLPDGVLLKEGALTDSEWQLVKQHPVMSVRIMEGMEFLDREIPAVRYHHERYDGTGYPEGLAGWTIPLPARILCVADAFDAMTSSRVYRGGMPVAAALAELRLGSGTQFDPAVVSAFLEVAARENITDETLAGTVSAMAE